MNDETDGDDAADDDTAKDDAAVEDDAAKDDTTEDDTAEDEAALEELRREFGDRWDIGRMTGGYRAIPRGIRGTPIPRYGHTPAELGDSIRRIEGG